MVSLGKIRAILPGRWGQLCSQTKAALLSCSPPSLSLVGIPQGWAVGGGGGQELILLTGPSPSPDSKFLELRSWS